MLPGNLFRGIARDVAAGGETTLSITGIAAKVAALPFGANHIIVKWGCLASAGNPSVSLRINGDASALYNAQDVKGAGSSKTALRTNAATSLPLGTLSSTAFEFSGGEITIPAAFLATHKSVVGLYGEVENNVSAVAGRYASTDAVDEISIVISSGSFVAASVLEVGVADEMFAIAGAEDIKTEDGTFTVQGIPQLSGDVVLIGNLRTDRAFVIDNGRLEINTDSTSGNYAQQFLFGSVSSLTAGAPSSPGLVFPLITGAPAAANAFGAAVCVISNPAGNENDSHILGLAGSHGDPATAFGAGVGISSTRRNNVEPIESIQVKPDVGTNFVTGSMLSAYFVPKNVIAYKKLESDAASVTFDLSELQGYRDLKVSCLLRGVKSGSNDNMQIIVNSDATASKYDWQNLQADGSSVQASPVANNPTTTNIPAASDIPNVFASAQFTFFEYTQTDRFKHYLQITGHNGAFQHLRISSHVYKDTAAISTLTFSLTSGEDFATDSIFTVEGIGKDNFGWEDEQVPVPLQTVVDWGETDTFDGEFDDISADVSLARVKGGRDVASTLDGRVKAARVTLTVENDDGRYSPDSTTSPIAGLVQPKRTVKIRSYTPVVRDLFTGHIEKILPSVNNKGVKIVKISCYGVFGSLTQNEINIPFADTKQSGAAVTAILNAAAASELIGEIDDGEETFENWIVDDIQTMTALRRVEESEPGLLVETRGGKIDWEGRTHRQKQPHVIAQAEYSDDPTALGALTYESIKEIDPLRFIFNDFRATVTKRKQELAITLWTHPEANTTGDAPELEPGDSVEYWAGYPNEASRTDAKGVRLWTPLVATTDYTANTLSNGTGTDRTASIGIAEDDFARRKKITITNNHPTDNVFLTKLQNRGDATFELDPVGVRSEDAASQAMYGQRTFNRSNLAVWIPNTQAAKDWTLYMLSLHKDRSPMIAIGYTAQRSLYHAVDLLTRQVSDRVGIEADGNADLGVNEDFFVEAYEYTIQAANFEGVLVCSSAAAFSAYWTLGFSILGSETRLNP